MESVETLDVIAVGAHPDDCEIGCGGTLARLAQQGYRVGIVDLTDGEPTPLCASPEIRLAEAQAAAGQLGIAKRVVLNLPNRRLFDSFEARVALAGSFAASGPGSFSESAARLQWHHRTTGKPCKLPMPPYSTVD